MTTALAAPKPISVIGWVRIVIRIAAMAMLLFACVPLHYLWRIRGSHNPVPRAFLGSIVWITGVDIRIVGTRVNRGALLLANHVSWLDVPAIAGATGAAFVGHDGLATLPLLRWLCSLNDTVFIARHDRASVHNQIEHVREAIRDTGALAIFPEGTTSDGTGLLPFKSSLLSALYPLPPGIAVQPVLLDYGPDAASIAWVGKETGFTNFKRILARGKPLELTVHFLPVLEGEALASRKTMAAAARDEMLRELQAI